MKNHRIALLLAATALCAGPTILTEIPEGVMRNKPKPPVPPPDPMPKPFGLRERIAQATTEAEVHRLMSEGRLFDSASKKTRRSWQTTAKRRLAFLANMGGAK